MCSAAWPTTKRDTMLKRGIDFYAQNALGPTQYTNTALAIYLRAENKLPRASRLLRACCSTTEALFVCAYSLVFAARAQSMLVQQSSGAKGKHPRCGFRTQCAGWAFKDSRTCARSRSRSDAQEQNWSVYFNAARWKLFNLLIRFNFWEQDFAEN